MSEEDYWAEFPDTLLTADVAKIIRTGVGAVRARLHAGTIPGYHLGGSWIMFKPEIRAWLASASNQPQPPSRPVDLLATYPDELSHHDLAQLLRKSKQTVYTYLERGVIPGAFVGGRWVVHKWQVRDRLTRASNQAAATDTE
ncbi:helix-turn-helix domain-containing protein [Microbacterium sp. A1-JK]|uniref:helix-turn-helix domain-containing protein n=1 Tax=Microbacterium sp. A1-JK TaxID=3177516 RepID=UPI003889B5B2